MFKDSSPIVQLLITGFVVIASTLAFFIVGALLAIPLFDVNFFSNPTVIVPGAIDNINVSKFFQFINSVGFFIVPPFILAWLFASKTGAYLYINKKTDLLLLILVILSILMIIPFIEYTALFNSKMQLPESLSWLEQWMRESEDNATEITISFLQMNNLSDFIINITIIALLPALGEELLFRGILQNIFIKWTKNIHWGIIITAILFSAFHLQFYGFIPRMLIGIYLGYLFVWTKNIWYPVLAHFVNNVSIVIYVYFTNVNVEEALSSETSDNYPLTMVIAGVIFFTLLTVLIYRKTAGRAQANSAN